MKKNNILIMGLIFMLALIFLPLNFSQNKQITCADDEITYISISSVSDLNKIGVHANYSVNSNYILTADIDYSGSEFSPIGQLANPFTGTFDGNGYKIKNVELLNKTSNYYYHGIFAFTQGATIKNLAVENITVERTGVYPDVESNQSTVYVGGLVALAEDTIINQCYVTFDTSSVETTTSLYFGGLVAKAYAGTNISSSYAVSYFTANISGEQAIEVKMGGLVGVLENSTLKATHAKGNIQSYVALTSEGQLTAITTSAVGGSVGYISGYNSAIINSYVDMFVYAESVNASVETLKGGLVGKVAENIASTPKTDNISYAQIKTNTYSKNGETDTSVQLNQEFGQINYYDKTTSNLVLLSQNNYESFNNASLWSQYPDSMFDFGLVWTFQSDSLPTLQKFAIYNIELKAEETIVDLGENTANADVVNLQFVSGNGTFRFGDTIQILISLINGYDYYYNLDSVELNLQEEIVFGVTNDNYSLELLESDNALIPSDIESEKNYLLTYSISDLTNGDVSVKLHKVNFELNVETQNASWGLVRKKDSTIAKTDFIQELQNANTYDFFAIAVNNNYAFSKWVFVKEVEGGEDQTIELGTYANFAQLTFVFGIGGQEEMTENILQGNKLVAVFTSNVTKVQFLIQVQGEEDGSDAGYITTTVGGDALDISELITFQKEVAVTLIANANSKYEFVGWFDGENRNVSTDASLVTLNFVPTEDEQILIARFALKEQTVSLTWLWIVLGVLGAGGLGVGIFFIIRSKTGDRAYRNFY